MFTQDNIRMLGIEISEIVATNFEKMSQKYKLENSKFEEIDITEVRNNMLFNVFRQLMDFFLIF